MLTYQDHILKQISELIEKKENRHKKLKNEEIAEKLNLKTRDIEHFRHLYNKVRISISDYIENENDTCFDVLKKQLEEERWNNH